MFYDEEVEEELRFQPERYISFNDQPKEFKIFINRLKLACLDEYEREVITESLIRNVSLSEIWNEQFPEYL